MDTRGLRQGVSFGLLDQSGRRERSNQSRHPLLTGSLSPPGDGLADAGKPATWPADLIKLDADQITFFRPSLQNLARPPRPAGDLSLPRAPQMGHPSTEGFEQPWRVAVAKLPMLCSGKLAHSLWPIISCPSLSWRRAQTETCRARARGRSQKRRELRSSKDSAGVRHASPSRLALNPS